MKLAEKHKKRKKKRREDLKENDLPFVKGYSPIRRLVERSSRYIRTCYNCEYFYQAVGDDEEVCQNEHVLKYDMIFTEGAVYCNQWRLSARKTSAKTLFKGGHKYD